MMNLCIIVLYFFVLYLSISIALLTALAFQKRSRPQQLKLCRSYMPKRYRQDLPKVKQDLNPLPSGRKTSTLPMRHHATLKHCAFLVVPEGSLADCRLRLSSGTSFL